jgi:hypothetical protein
MDHIFLAQQIGVKPLCLLSWAAINIQKALYGFDLLMDKIEKLNHSGSCYGNLNAKDIYYDADRGKVMLTDWSNASFGATTLEKNRLGKRTHGTVNNQTVVQSQDRWGLCWVFADMVHAAFNRPDPSLLFPS